ncbi:hypothetical protein [Streptomyces sp. NPDC048606]|uniref:hypothetical protein n=1 Tax=Streptomyces sp. NPDC048606 TaxID=3154726 RepID=UPI00341471F5
MPVEHGARRRETRIFCGAGLACVLVAALASPGHAAVGYTAPNLLGLTLSPPDAIVTFRDNVKPNSDGEGTDGAVGVTISERANPAVSVTKFVPGVPGTGKVVTRSVRVPIKPNTAYCAQVKSAILVDGRYTEHTAPSNTVCAGGRPGEGTESGTASLPDEGGVVITDEGAFSTDVSLRGVTGEATAPVGSTRNYWVRYTNEGRVAAENLTLVVQTSGALGIRRPPDSGAFNGFTCAALGASGGATAGYRCTGGSLKAGQSAEIPVLAKVAGPGAGTIHVSIDYPNDPIKSNNSTTFSVQAQ